MSRLPATFDRLRKAIRPALVAFVTAGDPFPDRTVDVLHTLADAGADILELGIPFSDPLADGPIVQSSTQRALDAGMTPPRVLEIVQEFRTRNNTTPVVLMGSWNPVMQFGAEEFALAASQSGVDGTILTDLSPDEAQGWVAINRAVDLSTIFLLAPTSTPERMALVGELASGFVYCVSRTGVTGSHQSVSDELPALIARIKTHTTLPVCVGFGISKPEHAATVAKYADGVVVGSALVQLLHNTREHADGLVQAADFIRELKAAT